MLSAKTVDMIYDTVIVGPNAALDSYYTLDVLKLKGVNRTSRVLHTAGGKAHNMARAMRRLEGCPLSIGIVGGSTAQFIRRELTREKIAHDLVTVQAETRHCLTIVVNDHEDSTVILDNGLPVGDSARELLLDKISAHVGSAPFLALTGSLPPDFPTSFFATVVKRFRDAAHVCVDTSGECLRYAAAAGPAVIKVNAKEFRSAFDFQGPISSWNDIGPVFTRLAKVGLQLLVITDDRRGAVVFSKDEEPFRVQTSVDSWVSTAGAGDTFMAGLLLVLSRGGSIGEAAKLASAAAAANLQQVGCGFFAKSDADRFLEHTTLTSLEGRVVC